MKHIHTFENFLNENLNEAIEIVSMTDYGVSNSNKSETTRKLTDIESILTDPDSWTDDLSFKDKLGNVYSIDDLIDKEVKIGNKKITVVEER